MRHLLLASLFLTGCATTPPAAPPRPLYERLGGKEAIAAVVDDFLARVGKDARINARFASTDMPRLRTLLVEQVCEATGGPCKYTGRDMRVTHAGMLITEAEFVAIVEDLKGALDHLKVPAAEQGQLLGALGPMKKDIVELDAAAPASHGPRGAVGERAQALREGATLLDKAGQARGRGNRSLADQLFSGAELIVGPDLLADLAPLFREGAPPRVATPLTAVPRDTPPQPVAVGSSAEDEPEEAPRRGSLSGTVRLPGGALDGFAVVTLEPVSGRFRRRQPKHRVIEQRNREFAPRVLTVPVGSTVSFPNFDGIYHNVFSRSEARPFDLGIYKSGNARELVFDREGIVRIGCNLHANMAAYVVVVSAPHYVITDGQGAFTFRSVEPGRYRLRAWAERSDTPAQQEIEIKADRNTVTVTLAGDRTQGPLADKFGAPRVAPRR